MADDDQQKLPGGFIETAFTEAEVEEAQAEEIKKGSDNEDDLCAFLRSDASQ